MEYEFFDRTDELYTFEWWERLDDCPLPDYPRPYIIDADQI